MPIIILLVVLTILFPDLIRVGQELFTAGTTVTKYYAKKALWGLAIYAAILGVFAVVAAFALAGENNVMFAVIVFVIALAIMPLQGVIEKAVVTTNGVTYPTFFIARPKMPIVIMLLLLYAATTALAFPHIFFTGAFGIYFLLLLIVGQAMNIAFPSNRFLSRTVLGLLILGTVGFWALLLIAPEPVEAVVIGYETSSSATGRQNLISALAVRPVMKVTAAEGTPVFLVKKSKWGKPLYDPNGLVITEPSLGPDGKQEVWKKDTEFKTSGRAVDQVDAGQILVKAFRKTDNSWIQKPLMVKDKEVYLEKFIAVEDTELGQRTDSLNSGSGDKSASDPEGSKSILAKDSAWVPICRGDCSLQVSGQIDFGGIKTGPSGVHRTGPGVKLATAPNLNFGALIAKVGENGKPFIVTNNQKIKGGDETVYIIVNDSIRSDNSGYFSVVTK